MVVEALAPLSAAAGAPAVDGPDSQAAPQAVSCAVSSAASLAAPLVFPHEHASDDDLAVVTALLTRLPKTAFTIIVRDSHGVPVVIRNAPLEADGTPMPTRFWLVGPAQIEIIGRLEAGGGVRRAQVEIDPALIEETHRRHAVSRDAQLPADWTGYTPSGGVAGTRRGVKCLHAHYACWLAGEPDAVGEWVAGVLFDQLPPVRRYAPSDSTDTATTSANDERRN